MQPAGLKALEAREEAKTGLYSYENRPQELDEPYASRFRQNEAAWTFFQSQPPGYRRMATWWVVSGRKEETRLKRLETLIEDSEAGRRIAPLSRPERAG
jgi:uncharacterized protein YdeI (YjbR/CyaY-like superfamily)